MRTVHALTLAILVLGLCPRTAEAAEQIGPYYENPRWGFKVRAPKD